MKVDVASFGGRDSPPAEMERRLRSWGVSDTKKIVIYDQGGSFLATSIFFDLYYHGFPADRLFVLDGGLAKWQAAGGALTKETIATPAPGTFRVAKLRDEVRVRLPEFLIASGDPVNNVLVEANDATYHFGGAKFFDRAGHVPNAVMLPATDFFNAAAPNMLREKDWVASWGSRMTRMYGVSRLSVVDVREPELYQQNHVPYAVNVPEEIFRRHSGAPGKPAEVLGAAGVDPSHDVVIVSAGGLNTSSAFAFLQLKKLGHEKVAVLTESMDDWGLGGLPLTKNPTTVGPRKSPQDLAIPLQSIPTTRARESSSANRRAPAVLIRG